jgi:DNA-binding transcriptional LysR family regulator
MNSDHPKSLSSVRIHHLAYLKAAVEAPNWTAAADLLNVTQSAISQGIAQLERTIGVPLFIRSGRRRVLTDDGAEVLRFAATVLAEAERLERRLDQRRHGLAGTLRVGMIDAAGLYLFPTAVSEFREQQPQTELRLVIDNSEVLLDMMRRGSLDLAVVVAPADGVDSEEILAEPLFVYAGRGIRGGPGPGAQWALYPEGSHTRAAIDDGFARLGLRPVVVAESPNPSVLRQMADLGLGWTVLPPAVAEQGPKPLRRWGDAIAARKLLAVHHPGGPDARSARLLAMIRKVD